jgi:peptidoglycan-associated lipoprotein
MLFKFEDVKFYKETNMLLKNLALAFCVLVALSGCSSHNKKISNTTVENLSFEKNVGDRVHFGFDKHDLTHEAKAQIDRQADWLVAKERENLHVIVEGHCDERGTREYNLALGEKRAHAVKHHLVSKGVHASRIETISYGKEKPARIGNSEEDHQMNRRSVTVIK